MNMNILIKLQKSLRVWNGLESFGGNANQFSRVVFAGSKMHELLTFYPRTLHVSFLKRGFTKVGKEGELKSIKKQRVAQKFNLLLDTNPFLLFFHHNGSKECNWEDTKKKIWAQGLHCRSLVVPSNLHLLITPSSGFTTPEFYPNGRIPREKRMGKEFSVALGADSSPGVNPTTTYRKETEGDIKRVDRATDRLNVIISPESFFKACAAGRLGLHPKGPRCTTNKVETLVEDKELSKKLIDCNLYLSQGTGFQELLCTNGDCIKDAWAAKPMWRFLTKGVTLIIGCSSPEQMGVVVDLCTPPTFYCIGGLYKKGAITHLDVKEWISLHRSQGTVCNKVHRNLLSPLLCHKKCVSFFRGLSEKYPLSIYFMLLYTLSLLSFLLQRILHTGDPEKISLFKRSRVGTGGCGRYATPKGTWGSV